MSDAIIDGSLTQAELMRMVKQANAEAAKYRHQARQYRQQLDGLRAEFEQQLEEARAELVELAESTEAMAAEFEEEKTALAAERDEWQAHAESLPDDVQETIEDLSSQIKTFRHQEAFKQLYEDPELTEKGLALRKDLDVAKLWKLLDYAPEADEPDLDAIKERLAGLQESDRWLFEAPAQAAAQTPPGGANGKATTATGPLTKGLDRGRGAPVATAVKTAVTQAQLSDPQFTAQNRDLLADPASWYLASQ